MPDFFRKFAKMSQNLSSAAVVIGALRVNSNSLHCALAIIAMHLYQNYTILNLFVDKNGCFVSSQFLHLY